MTDVNKKYELIEDYFCADRSGFKVFRIRALRAFGDVKQGDLGGFIQSEENLSHDGNCWVSGEAWAYEEAQVFGDAWIHENARVFGKAQIFEHACISEYANVYDEAQVFGHARVSGEAEIFGKAKICGHVLICRKEKISRGMLR